MKNSNETSQRYLTAMETLHRVDNILFLETVSALDDVILSNQQLSSLLFNNIVNPATSVTNTILLALQKTATIIEGDANSLKNDILASLETCYYRNIDFIIQSLNSQLETLVQNLASVQMILKMYPNFSNSELLTLEGYQNQIVQLNNTMSRSYDYMGRVNDSTCPTKLLQTDCYVYFQPVMVATGYFNYSLQQVMSQSLQNSDVDNLVYQINQGVKQAMTNMSSCITNYSQILSSFGAFLADFNIDTSSMYSSSYNSLLSLVNNDAEWLQSLLDSYLSGDILKSDLATQFFDPDTNQLLVNIDNVLTNIQQSVIYDINSFLTSVTTQAVTNYVTTLEYLGRLQTILGDGNTFIENVARRLTVWQMPLFWQDNASAVSCEVAQWRRNGRKWVGQRPPPTDD